MKPEEILHVDQEPGCKAVAEKLVQVKLDGTEIERESNERLAALGRPVGASLDSSARDYLRTGNLEAAMAPRPDAELGELYARRRVNQRAERMLRDELTAARGNYSRKICVQLLPAYRDHAQAIADALMLLLSAVRAERAFRVELEDKGLSVSLPPAAFPYLGYDVDRPDHGFAARWIVDARKAGLIR